jgi:hypothetical protein
MALINIKDLPQSDDLDREAMRSIVGGGATGARPFQSDQARVDQTRVDQTRARSGRIVDYPPGFRYRGPMTEPSF